MPMKMAFWPFHEQTVPCGSFSHSVILPEDLEADNAEAAFEDGLLTLTIPKAPEAKPKVIKIKAKKK